MFSFQDWVFSAYLDCMLLPKPRFQSTGGMRIVRGKPYGSLLHLLHVLSVWLKRRSLIILNEASLYVLTSLVLLPCLVYCYSQKCCISDCICRGFMLFSWVCSMVLVLQVMKFIFRILFILIMSVNFCRNSLLNWLCCFFDFLVFNMVC